MKTKILALAASSLFASSVFAASSVALVDLTTVFQSVPQGSAAFSALKQTLSPQVKQLQAAQENLQAQAASIQANKKLTKAELAAQEKQLAKKGQALQKQINTFQESATQQEQTLLATFGKDVKTVVANIAKQNDYTIVLSNQSTLYRTDDSDITQQVISALKAQAPTK